MLAIDDVRSECPCSMSALLALPVDIALMHS